MSSIFVQIASYRDKELLPTLRHLVAKSSGSNKITIGLMWQKENDETIAEFGQHPSVRIIDCHWSQSKGLGWARSLIQTLYKDEDYILQLDSHHRFLNNWDIILIDTLNSLKNDHGGKPLLTSYAHGYSPSEVNDFNHGVPCQVDPRDFKSSGTIWFKPRPIDNCLFLKKPVRARFVSGHYFFTEASHIKEYKYDPDIYFAGDEITLSVRSYTLGYDLYHPHVNVVWHHYGRNDRIKHWTDHNIENKNSGIVEYAWADRDVYSKKRIRQMLGMEDNGIDLGEFGLGKIRTIEQYEKYAGIDFKNKRIQNSAINGLEPPVVFSSEEEYEKDFIKTVPITMRNWGQRNFLEYKDQIDYFNVQLWNLQKQVIYEKRFDKNILTNNSILELESISFYHPMKILIHGMKNNEIIKTLSSDLMNSIHWG